ncbi:MAG: hypothetical protein ABW213_16020 [Tardiphaga sp.]
MRGTCPVIFIIIIARPSFGAGHAITPINTRSVPGMAVGEVRF